MNRSPNPYHTAPVGTAKSLSTIQPSTGFGYSITSSSCVPSRSTVRSPGRGEARWSVVT